MAISSTGYKVGKHPLAQSFYVRDNTGIFLTDVEVFFETKDEEVLNKSNVKKEDLFAFINYTEELANE